MMKQQTNAIKDACFELFFVHSVFLDWILTISGQLNGQIIVGEKFVVNYCKNALKVYCVRIVCSFVQCLFISFHFTYHWFDDDRRFFSKRSSTDILQHKNKGQYNSKKEQNIFWKISANIRFIIEFYWEYCDNVENNERDYTDIKTDWLLLYCITFNFIV